MFSVLDGMNDSTRSLEDIRFKRASNKLQETRDEKDAGEFFFQQMRIAMRGRGNAGDKGEM